MKTFLFVFFMFSFLISDVAGFGNTKIENQTGEQPASAEVESIQIVSSPELFNLASGWVSGFESRHPEFKVVVNKMDEQTQLTEGNLYFFTRDQQKMIENQPEWKITVGHDVVVPVIHSNNPLREELYRQGLTSEDFAQLVSGNTDWSAILDGAEDIPLHFYVLENPQVITKIANFTKTDPSDILATKVETGQQIISAVQQDIYAVGFCRLTDVLQPGETTFTGQISILPIDKNQNGRIDGFEQIFTNPGELARGVWVGKYPGELSGEIYVMSVSKPLNQAVISFLEWTINEGQESLGTLGYSSLSSREKVSGMLAMRNPSPSSEPAGNAPVLSTGWLIVLGIGFVLLLTLAFIRLRRRQKAGVHSEDITITPALNVNSISAPAGLFYDKTHTWAFMEQNGLVKIGINDFIQHLTGQITQIKMKAPGEMVRKGEKVLTLVHEGKQLELYSPVSGTIKQQNQTLLDTPGQINSAPYTDGWVYQIEPGNWIRETRFFSMAGNFKEWLEDEFLRLKDFLATSANSNSVVFEHVVLQDGGELTDNVLADLDPEVWEDFQAHFIDTSK